MPTVSVYVSDDLKLRMDMVEGVIWSRIACDAFESKLGEIAAERKEKTMQDVVQRLRASKIRMLDDIAKEGREAGIEWAKNEAEAVQLRRLERHLSRLQFRDEAFILPEDQPTTGARQFAKVVDGEPDSPFADLNDFWRCVLGDDVPPPDDHFVQAFAEAALEIWDQVSGKI